MVYISLWNIIFANNKIDIKNFHSCTWDLYLKFNSNIIIYGFIFIYLFIYICIFIRLFTGKLKSNSNLV